MQSLSFVLPASAALLACFSVLPAAHAQAPYPLSLTFTSPNQTVGPGGALHFTGTLTNTSSSLVFLNSDSVSFNAPVAGLTLDDSPFLTNAPMFLAAGPIGSSYTGDFFDVMVSPSAVAGTYQGTFDVLGGGDTGTYDIVGSQTFFVSVPEAVPEASTTVSMGLLLALGGGGLMIAKRRRTAAAS